MGMLDWLSDVGGYVADAVGSAASSVADAASSVIDWVSDWFEDDSSSVNLDSDDYNLSGEFGSDWTLTDDYKLSDYDFGDTEGLADGGISLTDSAGEGGLLGSIGDAVSSSDYQIDASKVTTDKSDLFKDATLSDKTGKTEDKDKSWWSEIKDVVKSEGGGSLLGGLLSGGLSMYQSDKDAEEAYDLLAYKAKLENENYKYQYDVAHPASDGSSSSSSNDDEEESSGDDRITTLAAAYPAKTDFHRS